MVAFFRGEKRTEYEPFEEGFAKAEELRSGLNIHPKSF